MEGAEEGLSNKEIDESPRSFAFVPITTACIFDFLHATAQEMDSCIPKPEKGRWRRVVRGGRNADRERITGEKLKLTGRADDLHTRKFGNPLFRASSRDRFANHAIRSARAR